MTTAKMKKCTVARNVLYLVGVNQLRLRELTREEIQKRREEKMGGTEE
jgi:hypothetical protein